MLTIFRMVFLILLLDVVVAIENFEEAKDE